MTKFKFIILKQFYTEKMLPNEDYSYIFDFKYNGLHFTMLMSRNETDEMILYFAKVGTQDELSLSISEDFDVVIFLETGLYKKMKDFFEIKFDPNNKFQPVNLFKFIDKNSKPKPFNSTLNRKSIVKIYKLNNPDAIYYKNMINWDNSDSGKKYSKENRDKVKKLLPKLYELIKDKNISVSFTEHRKSEKDEVVEYNADISKK